MGITIGGKPVTPATAKTRPLFEGHHRVLTAEQVAKRHPAEPFPSLDVFRNQSVESRLSQACDLKGWIEQRLGEMATLADEATWLTRQLADPALEGHRMRQDAITRLRDMNTLIAEYASDAAFLEAHCDRIWQSLDIPDRASMSAAWAVTAGADRIILQTWNVLARVGYKWPDRYAIQRKWFGCLARPLIEDMEAFGLRELEPLGEIPADPFEDEEEA